MCAVQWARCFVAVCTPQSFTEQNNMLHLKMNSTIILNYAIKSKQHNHVRLNQAVGRRQLTVQRCRNTKWNFKCSVNCG